MDLAKYGPFASVVGIACALVALFSILLVKMVGSVKQWTWLASDSPPFLVTAAARVLAVALMALTYISLNETNYTLFGLVAVVSGILAALSIAWFDRLRRVHVLNVPLVGSDGRQIIKRGKPQYKSIVIGLEREINETAKKDLKAARRRHGGVSLVAFMSGYGEPSVNNPEALWDRGDLAKISSRLTVLLMAILLFSVMTLFMAAFVIDTANRRP